MKRLLLVLMTLMPLSVIATEKATDPSYLFNDYHVAYDINADGTFVQTRTYTLTVLKESAIEDAKRDTFSYSTSIEEGEVLQAWTLKKNGSRVDVPKNNYQVSTEAGHNNGSPFFSDYTTVSVVFPDVAIGDQVHFSYRVRAKEAIFPGQFSVREGFSRYYPYVKADITVTAPAAMKIRHKAWNLKEEPAVVSKGRRTWRWSYVNPQPDKWNQEDDGIDVLSEEPTLLFSTLTDYRQIAEAYGVRARPKAMVTERVRKLAESIVSPSALPAEKARALYEWVAKNISYGGNCIGVGAVVPRDIDVILDNRIGDCKDHATLLQALLASVEVESTQALINAGSLYELPEIPVVSNVNHVINYLPSLKLFLDSTSSDTPYGHLPFGDADKPVLLVDGFTENKRTPPETGVENGQVMKTRIKVNPDGSATGEMKVGVTGKYAATARGWFKNMSADRRKDMVKYWVQKSSYNGSGDMQFDDVMSKTDDYNYQAIFRLEDFLQNTEAGAFIVRPVMMGPATAWELVGSGFGDAPTRSRSCVGGNSREEYVIEFPVGMKVLYTPKSRSFDRGGVSYSSTYTLDGNTVTLIRVISNTVEQNVCVPTLLAERHQAARHVMRELRSQILYQQVQ